MPSLPEHPAERPPPLPDSSYTHIASGYKNLAELVHRTTNDPVPDSLGFHYHLSLESLSASAGHCDLCRQIEIQADALLADVAKRNAKWAEFPDVRTRPGDPSFDLWIKARAEAGDGLWVVSRSVSEPETVLFPIATFGFCSEDVKSISWSGFALSQGARVTGKPRTE